MKISGSNTNQNVMRFFELKINSNTSTDYKLKRTTDVFEDWYVEYKSEKVKKLSMELEHTYAI